MKRTPPRFKSFRRYAGAQHRQHTEQLSDLYEQGYGGNPHQHAEWLDELSTPSLFVQGLPDITGMDNEGCKCASADVDQDREELNTYNRSRRPHDVFNWLGLACVSPCRFRLAWTHSSKQAGQSPDFRYPRHPRAPARPLLIPGLSRELTNLVCRPPCPSSGGGNLRTDHTRTPRPLLPAPSPRPPQKAVPAKSSRRFSCSKNAPRPRSAIADGKAEAAEPVPPRDGENQNRAGRAIYRGTRLGRDAT